jgi:hypothetical protein
VIVAFGTKSNGMKSRINHWIVRIIQNFDLALKTFAITQSEAFHRLQLNQILKFTVAVNLLLPSNSTT